MKYTVKYRRKGAFFWKTVTKVIGDYAASDFPGFFFCTRENEEQVRIPVEGTEFWFSKERYLVIKKQAEREAGQKLNMVRGA